MAPNPPILSSAVIVPEADESAPQSPVTAKRRQSSISTEDSKRPRFSSPREEARKPAEAVPLSSKASKVIASKDSEERKRGKRLFGALLGTLNQSSSSAAQRRRGDIERKQQEKLKSQAQEHDEQKKRDRETLLHSRRAERDIYVEQAARTKREHELAYACFLQTETEPKLYYKPWDLLPGQKASIDAQITHIKAAVERQLDDDAKSATPLKDAMPNLNGEKSQESASPAHEIGADNIDKDRMEIAENPAGNPVEMNPADTDPLHRDQSEASREAADEGGDDFVKGDEDDVIY